MAMFEFDESVKNIFVALVTILKMLFLSWKENYTLYSWYIFSIYFIQERFENRFYAHVNPHWEDHGAQTRRITRASHSDLHAISENKISTERKTNEIWISTSLCTSLRTVRSFKRNYKSEYYYIFPLLIFLYF